MLFFIPGPYRMARRCMRRSRRRSYTRSNPTGPLSDIPNSVFRPVLPLFVTTMSVGVAGISSEAAHGPEAMNTTLALVVAVLFMVMVAWGGVLACRYLDQHPDPPTPPIQQGPPSRPTPPPPDPAPLPVSPKPSPRPLNRQAPIDRPYPWRPYY